MIMITIPKQHYVGRKQQGTAKDLPLGFATPVETKGFDKRKATVDSWAHVNSWEQQRGQEQLDAITVDNELLEGFQIAESVRRIYWGGGNVVWRVIDPRGYELEIPSSNLARILDCCDVEKGVIKQRCIWGRDGAQNILLPENSEPYQSAVANTDRSKIKVPMKEINIGDLVVFKDGTEVVYMGTYSIGYLNETTVRERGTGSYYGSSTYSKFEIDVKRRSIFIDPNVDDKAYASRKYQLIASPHISEIKKKQEVQYTDAEIDAFMSTFLNVLHQNRYAFGLSYAFTISKTTIKPSDFKFDPTSCAAPEMSAFDHKSSSSTAYEARRGTVYPLYMCYNLSIARSNVLVTPGGYYRNIATLDDSSFTMSDSYGTSYRSTDLERMFNTPGFVQDWISFDWRHVQVKDKVGTLYPIYYAA